MKKIDQEIIESILNGRNQKALDHLYKEPLRKIRYYITSNSGTVEDANDIFQDALVVLFHYVKTDKYNTAYDIDAFLFRVAKNAWIDHARKNKKQAKNVEVDHLNISSDSNQLGDILKLEKKEMFHEMFNQLEDKCQELLRLAIFDKKSMKEIKEIMGFKHETVAKSQHYRCKQYFAKILLSNKQALSILRP